MSQRTEIYCSELAEYLQSAGHLLQSWRMENLNDEVFVFGESAHLHRNIQLFEKGEKMGVIKITDQAMVDYLRSRGHKSAGWSQRPGEVPYWLFAASPEVREDLDGVRAQRRTASGRDRTIGSVNELLEVLVEKP